MRQLSTNSFTQMEHSSENALISANDSELLDSVYAVLVSCRHSVTQASRLRSLELYRPEGRGPRAT